MFDGARKPQREALHGCHLPATFRSIYTAINTTNGSLSSASIPIILSLPSPRPCSQQYVYTRCCRQRNNSTRHCPSLQHSREGALGEAESSGAAHITLQLIVIDKPPSHRPTGHLKGQCPLASRKADYDEGITRGTRYCCPAQSCVMQDKRRTRAAERPRVYLSVAPSGGGVLLGLLLLLLLLPRQRNTPMISKLPYTHSQGLVYSLNSD